MKKNKLETLQLPQDRRKFLKNAGALGLGLLASPLLTDIFAQNTPAIPKKEGMSDKLIPFEDPNAPWTMTHSGQEQHTIAEIESAYKEMTPVHYYPASNRWLNLPIVNKALTSKNSSLNIVMLGDSIINDTYRSQWDNLVLQPAYPNCKISCVAIVRGSTGCWYYKEGNNIEKYVLPHNPDLLIIGGISQKDDIDSIREVIKQVQSARKCDVLLMTKSYGEVSEKVTRRYADPYLDYKPGVVENGWSYDIPTDPQDYRRRLLELAQETKSGFLDMTAPWGAYIRQSGKPLDYFKRDIIHANVKGEQIIGRILAAHLSPVKL